GLVLGVELDALQVARRGGLGLAEVLKLDLALARVEIAETVGARGARLDELDGRLVEIHGLAPALALVAQALERGEGVAVGRIGEESRAIVGERTVDVAAALADLGDARVVLGARRRLAAELDLALERAQEVAVARQARVDAFESGER